MKYDVIVVGAGICGISASRLLAERGMEVLLIEQKPQVGGLCDEGWYKNVRYSKFGAHLFHTNDQEVFDFVTRFCDWAPYFHRVKSFDAGQLWDIPISREDRQLISELDEKRLVDRLYGNYSKKMWGQGKEPKNSIARLNINRRAPWDRRYFTDKYQGFPRDGYSEMFKEMLDHSNIQVLTNTHFLTFERFRDTPIIYTGRLDDLTFPLSLPFKNHFFRYDFGGEFPWSKEFGVINFPYDFDFIRSYSNRILYQQKVDADVVVYESSEFLNYHERNKWIGVQDVYPIITEESRLLHDRILTQVNASYPRLYPAGRAGTFSYMDMDQAIRSGFQACWEIETKH